MFIGLNPSTADESQDDPTTARCVSYAKSWGYGGLVMANLFAWRASDPKAMRACKRPVGSGNDRWLKKLAKSAGIVVAAWGNSGCYLDRSKHVVELIPDLHCLKINRSGEPAHPLYQKAELRPAPMGMQSAQHR